jgi:hypothetical protein
MKKNKKINESFNNLSNVKSLNKINNITEQQVAACSQQDFNNMSDNLGLPGLFVNGNPTNFINNMYNKYSNKGCEPDGSKFLLKVLNKHEDHMSSGMGGPQGNKQMGPKWKDQKQSKIDFLKQVIQDCCPYEGGGTNNPTLNNEAETSDCGNLRSCNNDGDCQHDGYSCEDGCCIIACKKGESDTECKARKKKSLEEGNIHLNHSLVERMQKLANIIK